MAEAGKISITDRVGLGALIVAVVQGVLPLTAPIRALVLLAALGAAIYLCWHASWRPWRRWSLALLFVLIYVSTVFWLFDREARAEKTTAPTTRFALSLANMFWGVPWRWIVISLVVGFLVSSIVRVKRHRKTAQEVEPRK